MMPVARWQLGEEPHARAIATAMDRARRQRPLQTTLELAAVVAGAVPPTRPPTRLHPATRTFQALRIYVNREVRARAAASTGEGTEV
jgi:16S rRNA (cytosine1402-N4)-methyltransferase